MVVVEVCGDLTLLSAGGSLLVYDHSSAKSRVINVFTENNNNNNNNNNNSTKTEEDEEEEEEEEQGGEGEGEGGGDNINGIKEETGSRDGTEGRKENDNKELKKKKKKKNEKSDEEEKKHDNSDTGNQSITAAKFSPCGRWLVVGGGWKAVEVWSVADWVRLASHTLPKRPTALAVTADSSCVLVADRAGDVYKFPLTTTTTTTATPPKPLLGHLSMLLDVAITPDRRYIVTCDRDEKVRLTHLAHTCLIHTFLLGHLEFVTCLAVISADPPRLLSCSGDGTIKLWDYEEGVCLSTLDLSPHVSPLPLPTPPLAMVARGGKRKPEGEEGEGSSTPPLPPTSPPAAATAVKKVAVISSSSSSSSSSSYLVAALVYRAWEVVLCRVEDTHLHVISTTALKGEPLGGAWRRRARRRRRKRTEEAEEEGGGGGGEELILVVKDASGGGGGGGVVVMEVVKDKLVEVEEEEEEKKEEEEEEERSTTLGRRYDHLVQGLSTPLDSNGVELALLYKQKYDNVGEYMKKKKEREKLAEEGVRLTKRGRWAR